MRPKCYTNLYLLCISKYCVFVLPVITGDMLGVLQIIICPTTRFDLSIPLIQTPLDFKIIIRKKTWLTINIKQRE